MSRRQDRDWNDYRHPAMDYEPPKQLKRFRAAMVLAVSTLLVGGLWTGGWFAAMAYLKGRIEAFAAGQAAQGATFAFDAIETAGYPARITFTLRNPRYEGPVAGVPVTWQGETLTLSTRPWMPWRFDFAAAGRHQIAWGEERLALRGTAQGLGGQLTFGAPWPKHAALAIDNLVLGGGASVIVGRLALDAEHDAQVKAGGTGLRLRLSAADLTLPLGGGWGFGDAIRSVDTQLRVTGPVLPGALAPRLEAWRAAGGALEVENLNLRYGPLAAAAAGTVALNSELQPEGAFTAKFEGLFQVLELLRARGLVRDADAVIATMALAALSKRPAGGGAATINLAVSLQDGKLALGSVPVLALPRIDWGPAAEPATAPEPPARDYKDVPPVY